MHLGRFHYAVNSFVKEHKEKNTYQSIQNIVSTLSAVSANPSQPQIFQNYKTALDACRKLLSESTLNNPRPILAMLFSSFGANEYIGNLLFERIKKEIDNNHAAPSLAAQAVNKIAAEFSEFYKSVAAIDDAFTKLEIEFDTTAPGGAEIGLLIPREENSTLQELGKEVNQWHKALLPLSEIFDSDAEPITINTVATTDWMFYLASTPLVLKGFSLCLKGINEILRELLESKHLIEKLRQKNYSEATVDALQKEHENKLDIEIRKLADKIIHDFCNEIDDKARKNELNNALVQSLKLMAQKIGTGTKIELKYVLPEITEADEGIDQNENDELLSIDQLKEISEQLDSDASLICFDAEAENAEMLLPLFKEEENE